MKYKIRCIAVLLMIVNSVSLAEAEIIPQYERLKSQMNPVSFMAMDSIGSSAYSVLDFAELGSGVMPADNSMAPIICINRPKDNEVSLGSTESQLRFKFIKDTKELASELNLNSSLKANYGLLSGSIQANYLSQTENNSNTLNFSFLSKNITKVRLNTNVRLNDKGALYQAEPSLFAKRCGTSIVTAQSLGSYLYASLSIQTASEIEKREIQSELKVTYSSLVDALVSVKNAVTNSGLRASIVLNIRQIGANPVMLNSILAKENMKDGVLNCSAKNIEPCVKIATVVMDYIGSDSDSTGYLYQLKKIGEAKTYSQLKTAGAVNIGSPYTISSDDIVEGANAPADFGENSEALFTRYQNQAKIYTAADSLRSLLPVRSSLYPYAQAITETARQNLQKIENALRKCMGSQGLYSCSDAVSLRPYNKENLSALSALSSNGLLKNNFQSFLMYPWSASLSNNKSWVISLVNNTLLLSGDFGENQNYYYQGINANNTEVGKLYNNKAIYAQNVDSFNFSGKTYYLTYAAKDQLQLEAPSIGINGLPKAPSSMFFWDPQNDKGLGGIISFNYSYIPENQDYKTLQRLIN